MINFLTGLALVGAAMTAIACAIAKLIIENGKCRIAESSSLDREEPIRHSTFSIIHSPFSIHTAVFALFAGVAVQYAGAKNGGTTKLKIEVEPNDFPESKINWRVVSGSGSFSDATGREAAFVASGAEDENVVVQVDVGDCPGRAPQFTMRTTTIHEVKIYPCAISRMGRPPPVTVSQINAMLDEVNVIYRQVGLHFSLGSSLMCVTNEIWSRDGLVDDGVSAQIRNIMSGKGGIEVYFIEGNGNVEDEPLGRHNPYGLIIKTSANAKTFAHEIGHACGWGDIYFKSGNSIITDLYGCVRLSLMPCDWNNGTGCRFYDSLLTQYQIIQRLLMLGTGSGSKCDIPAGSVYGRSADGDMGNISVGRSTMMTTSPHSL